MIIVVDSPCNPRTIRSTTSLPTVVHGHVSLPLQQRDGREPLVRTMPGCSTDKTGGVGVCGEGGLAAEMGVEDA
jgi:hypothetical protein